MMFMSTILGIFMFVSAVSSTVVIRLNRIVTLLSNQGGATLKSEKITK